MRTWLKRYFRDCLAQENVTRKIHTMQPNLSSPEVKQHGVVKCLCTVVIFSAVLVRVTSFSDSHLLENER